MNKSIRVFFIISVIVYIAYAICLNLRINAFSSFCNDRKATDMFIVRTEKNKDASDDFQDDSYGVEPSYQNDETPVYRQDLFIKMSKKINNIYVLPSLWNFEPALSIGIYSNENSHIIKISIDGDYGTIDGYRFTTIKNGEKFFTFLNTITTQPIKLYDKFIPSKIRYKK